MEPMQHIDKIKDLSDEIKEICIQYLIQPEPMALERITELQGNIEHEIHAMHSAEQAQRDAQADACVARINAYGRELAKYNGIEVLRDGARYHAAALADVNSPEEDAAMDALSLRLEHVESVFAPRLSA